MMQKSPEDIDFEDWTVVSSFIVDSTGDTMLNFETGRLCAGKLEFKVKPGDTVRLYTASNGDIRGIFINGIKVRYQMNDFIKNCQFHEV